MDTYNELQGGSKYTAFSWHVGLQPLVFLIGATPLYLLLLLYYENFAQRRRRSKE